MYQYIIYHRFTCGRWLGKGIDDGSIERLLVAELLSKDVDTEGKITDFVRDSFIDQWMFQNNYIQFHVHWYIVFLPILLYMYTE